MNSIIYRSGELNLLFDSWLWDGTTTNYTPFVLNSTSQIHTTQLSVNDQLVAIIKQQQHFFNYFFVLTFKNHNELIRTCELCPFCISYPSIIVAIKLQ